MIYANLKGGLANILIQMAAIKSMAIDNDVDCSFPNLDKQLDLLNNDMTYNPKIKHAYEYNIMFEHMNVSAPTKELPIIKFPFEYETISLPNEDVFVDGFFQSEKYFTHNRVKLLEWFKIPESINEKITNKYSKLLEQRTTGIHVRRGDYVRHPNHHPVQTREYYLEGIELLKDKTDLFIVFSDDIPWCKENLTIPNIVFIENERDYVEIYLMSLCNNNIISNSSFSWWGAWLNTNENKIVIGPKIWFGPAITFVSKDIIPETWIKI